MTKSILAVVAILAVAAVAVSGCCSMKKKHCDMKPGEPKKACCSSDMGEKK